MIKVIRQLILHGFQRHESQSVVPPELLATAISWSIYGAAQEWVAMSNPPSSEEMVDVIMKIVTPAFALSHVEAN